MNPNKVTPPGPLPASWTPEPTDLLLDKWTSIWPSWKLLMLILLDSPKWLFTRFSTWWDSPHPSTSFSSILLEDNMKRVKCSASTRTLMERNLWALKPLNYCNLPRTFTNVIQWKCFLWKMMEMLDLLEPTLNELCSSTKLWLPPPSRIKFSLVLDFPCWLTQDGMAWSRSTLKILRQEKEWVAIGSRHVLTRKINPFSVQKKESRVAIGTILLWVFVPISFWKTINVVKFNLMIISIAMWTIFLICLENWKKFKNKTEDLILDASKQPSQLKGMK